MPGEAVTLQLGHYSGCVGAHWWGLQAAALRSPSEHNELRAAALLRSARGPGGTESPEPRLVALELKGGVGALRADGADTEPPVSWDGAVADCRERGRAPRDTGSRRGDAAGDAKGNAGAAGPGSQDAPSPRLWSDYLSVNLHPQSLYVIRQYLHDGDCGCLEGFGQGESLLQDPACVEELEDRLHFFVEECDYLQGFQVLCDLHNGFSGVGARVTELLHDEYARKGILTWGLTPVLGAVGDPQKSFCRLMNTALGIAHLSRHSSLFCPLSLNGSLGLRPEPPVTFPYIKYNASLSYHSSAVLAAALDTLTAPYRLCSSQASMLHLADSLTFSGRKVVAAWAALPLPALAGSALPDVLGAHRDVPWQLLSSCKERKFSSCFAQSAVLRGLCQEQGSSRERESPEQVLQQYLHTQFPGAFRWVRVGAALARVGAGLGLHWHGWVRVWAALARVGAGLELHWHGWVRVWGCTGTGGCGLGLHWHGWVRVWSCIGTGGCGLGLHWHGWVRVGRIGTGGLTLSVPEVLALFNPFCARCLALFNPFCARCLAQFNPFCARCLAQFNPPHAHLPAAVGSVPVLAALQSCPALRALLSGLARELRPRRWGSSCTAGLELDDVQEALEELRSLAQCYETGTETGAAADGSQDEADSD
ncbi:protein misato homolog 1 [Zonotrichia leucophrys gambelii]|uniref:protein misato homolog 1 n=1 Tax=Zonotrichia leucophrys gambelii TaxID=257770 RepID=UPI0031407A25